MFSPDTADRDVPAECPLLVQVRHCTDPSMASTDGSSSGLKTKQTLENDASLGGSAVINSGGTKQDDFEKLLDTIGGHGRFQIFLWSVGFGSKTGVAMVFLFMAFAGATPDFWCLPPGGVSGGNGSDVVASNGSEAWTKARETVDGDMFKSCYANGSSCSSFAFTEGMSTIVSEWSLVCEKKWVSSTITSVQMAGILVGALLTGQAADAWGRRKVCIALLAGQLSFGLVNAFSTSWVFFVVTRFGVGACAGGYLVPYFSLVMEFTDKNWRAFLGAIPAWQIGAGLMSLAAWLLHDWQHLGILSAVFTLPFLCAWWFMPESVRWLLVRNRVDEAQAVLSRVAKANGRSCPDVEITRRLAANELSKAKAARVYSFQHLFKGGMACQTCLLLFVWFSSGATYYFLAFGAENLSGNLYFNIFLLSTVEVPGMFLAAFLNNKIGRRWTAFLCYMLAGVCSVVVIVLLNTGTLGTGPATRRPVWEPSSLHNSSSCMTPTRPSHTLWWRP